jgi:hypothetical protein
MRFLTQDIQNLEHFRTSPGVTQQLRHINLQWHNKQASRLDASLATDSHRVLKRNYIHFTSSYELNVRGRHLDAIFLHLTPSAYFQGKVKNRSHVAPTGRARLCLQSPPNCAVSRLEWSVKQFVVYRNKDSVPLPLVSLCLYSFSGLIVKSSTDLLTNRREKPARISFLYRDQIMRLQSAASQVVLCGPRPARLYCVARGLPGCIVWPAASQVVLCGPRPNS